MATNLIHITRNAGNTWKGVNWVVHQPIKVTTVIEAQAT